MQPFYIVAPAVWAEEGPRLSHAGSCLACCLWAQLVVGGLLPAVLHWALRRGPRRSGCRVTRLMDAWLGEQPVLVFCFLAEFVWIGLRALIRA